MGNREDAVTDNAKGASRAERVRIGGQEYEVHHVRARQLTSGDLIIEGRTAVRVRQAYPLTNGRGDKLVRVVTWDGTYGQGYDPEQMFKVARP